MPTYTYTAMDSAGREMRGQIEADTEQAAADVLRGRGLFPTALIVRPGRGTGSPAAAAAKPGESGRGLFGQLTVPRIRRKPLCTLTRQLATMIEAGLPLLRALRLLARQAKDPTTRTVVTDLATAIESGSSLSDAFSRHPRSFDRLYVSMLRAGEVSGQLGPVLRRQATYLEKGQRLRRRIKGAIAYPAVVCAVAILITAGLMIFIVPKFATVFTEMMSGKALPPLTRWVIAASDVLARRFHYVVGFAVLVFVLFKLLRKTTAGAFLLDSAALKIPAFGNLIELTAGARFCETLAVLMNAGVPVLNALQIVRDTCGNNVVARALQNVRNAVKEGESMSAPLAAAKVFPPMLIGMVEVGEETGALPEMLGRVAAGYEEEVDHAVDTLTSLIEPVMIVFLAIMVGTIVIALFLPLIVMIGGSGIA